MKANIPFMPEIAGHYGAAWRIDSRSSLVYQCLRCGRGGSSPTGAGAYEKMHVHRRQCRGLPLTGLTRFRR